MKVAIIGGSGKMGRWFARQLKQDGYEVVISGRDPQKLHAAGSELGVATADNVSAARQADVILLSVAIDSLTDVVRELGPHITPEQAVIDVTSVKEMPVTAMHQHLRTAKILGTHPLFGPGAKGLSGQNFALTPTGEAEKVLAAKVTQYLREKGAQVTVMTPREHDAMMTVILGLAHFIAIVSADTVLAAENPRNLEKISGVTYKVLLTL
ncbi:MAG: prephenate dehydrogenase/arogenate dehydrogenase family protein, partial [Chloroflexota bacterium]